MSRPTYTLVFRYHVGNTFPSRQVRKIPYNWVPSGTEVVDAIRRLRAQNEGTIEIETITLLETKPVHTYSVPGETNCVPSSSTSSP